MVWLLARGSEVKDLVIIREYREVDAEFIVNISLAAWQRSPRRWIEG